MVKYKKIKEGIFQSRPNRFVAKVIVDNKEETVHVKNTGRCKELLIKGTNVILEESDNPNRKTKYSLIAVYKGNMLINMDSQIPNAAAYEAILNGKIEEIGKSDFVKREKTYGLSRFDIYYEKKDEKGFVEVKGVTLEENGTVRFPDAPTERGRKHIYELIKAKKEGYEATILFVIQMEKADCFMPNWKTDSDFANALVEAEKNGVKILAYTCRVEKDGIELLEKVPIKLS